MVDRPILFSAPMVRSMLDGRKTQTRRILSAQNAEFGSAPKSYWSHSDLARAWSDGAYLHVPCHMDEDDGQKTVGIGCPHCLEMGWDTTTHRLYPKIQVGDRLWVRESWAPHSIYDHMKPRDMPPSKVFYLADEAYSPSGSRGRPGMFMPRWASRLTLTVTDVRVQRLKEISAEDADAECFAGDYPGAALPELFPGAPSQWAHLSIPECYGRLWDSINGADSWAANPWVAAYSFTVEQRNIDGGSNG